jgi:hypothetical protein
VFECLQKEWDTSCECFASPLNCQLSKYCSVFPEDAAFGSLGSFFQFSPSQGFFPFFLWLLGLKMSSRSFVLFCSVKVVCDQGRLK